MAARKNRTGRVAYRLYQFPPAWAPSQSPSLYIRVSPSTWKNRRKIFEPQFEKRDFIVRDKPLRGEPPIAQAHIVRDRGHARTQRKLAQIFADVLVVEISGHL